MILLFSGIVNAETYRGIEFSPLKSKIEKSVYTFNEDGTFFNEVNNDPTVSSFYGEYEMYTGYDGAGYIGIDYGAIMVWFMKDEDMILGWKAIISEKYNFNFLIIFGVKE